MRGVLIKRKNVVLLVGVALIIPLISVLNVQISVRFGDVIDYMLVEDAFWRALLVLVMITGLTYIFDKIILSFLLTMFSNGFVTDLHGALVRKFRTMEYAAFLNREPDSLFQICSKDIYDIQEFSVDSIIRFIISLFTGILAAGELWRINKMYPAAALLIYVVSLAITKPLGKRSERYAGGIRESEKSLTRIFFDLLDHFALLKSFGRVNDRISAFETENETFNETTVRSKICLNFFKTLTRVINSAAPVLIVCISISGFANGEITAGQIVAAVSLVSTLCVPIQNFGNIYVSVKRIWFKIKEIDAVLCEKDERQAAEGENLLRGDIVFEQVGYKVKDTNILSQVSFTIPFGKKTAIVGKTGSGKSTTMNLLSGLLACTEGRISVGGTEITEENRGALLKSVSAIPSVTYLVNDTLRNNLELGKTDKAELKRTEEKLKLDALAESLPNGYDTAVGANGVQLSGGQKKLIGLARGLSVNRNFFLLDEVTTGLDDGAVETVMQYLLEQEKTLVMITHNLKYIERMDHIILFDNGHVAASGTYEEIAKVWEGLYEA